MKDRIQQLMQSQHLNQQAFANKTGIAPATLSNIFSERTRPTLQHVEALMKTFPTLNLGWLLSGQGEMFTDSSSFSDGSIPLQQQTENSPTGGSLRTDNLSAQPNNQPIEQDMFAVGQNSINQPQSQQVRPIANNNGRNASYKTQQQATSSTINGISLQQQPTRKITEIRVFFDDQTWESFVPKKG